MAPPAFAVTKSPFGPITNLLQDTAQILGIKSQVERYSPSFGLPSSCPKNCSFSKTLILVKFCAVFWKWRQACNKAGFFERAYTYDILEKEERRQHFTYQLYNTANFAQLSTLYARTIYAYP
ncbi:MAG: hypothetical protein IPL73_14945 [Candidatus Obscuribacter sp.]|nr:hypothetical protein [Candidatus Obscuribacter sp.]